MGQVSVRINGRQYRMACDDGQEDHLTRLAEDLDQRIEQLRTDFGEIGDIRLTVMAALIVAHQLGEQGPSAPRFDDEVTALQDSPMLSTGGPKVNQAAIAS